MKMTKTSTTRVPFENWCDRKDQYRTAREAIFAIDMQVQASAEPEAELNTAWTAIAIWANAKGSIIAPQWLSHVARFHRLSMNELNRVREAIEMRIRAFEHRALAA
jgi:hypothetical protein